MLPSHWNFVIRNESGYLSQLSQPRLTSIVYRLIHSSFFTAVMCHAGGPERGTHGQEPQQSWSHHSLTHPPLPPQAQRWAAFDPPIIVLQLFQNGVYYWGGACHRQQRRSRRPHPAPWILPSGRASVNPASAELHLGLPLLYSSFRTSSTYRISPIHFSKTQYH